MKPQKSKPFKLKAGTVLPNFPACSKSIRKGSGTSTPVPAPPVLALQHHCSPPEHSTLVVIKPGYFNAFFGAHLLS